MPPSIWPVTCSGFSTLPDVLGGREVHDAHEPELGIDVDDGPVRGARERHVRVALPVGVERVREPVVELRGDVDRRRRP